MRQLEKTLKALANARRLAILKYLKRVRRASVSAIADELNLSLKATSKHLGILRAAEILDRDQQSLNMFYRLSDAPPATAKHIISIL